MACIIHICSLTTCIMYNFLMKSGKIAEQYQISHLNCMKVFCKVVWFFFSPIDFIGVCVQGVSKYCGFVLKT